MIINKGTLSGMVRDVGFDMFPGIRDIYVQESAETIERLKKSLDTGDYQTLARDIHTQKSVLGTYGADDALEQALRLDKKCKAKVPLTDFAEEVKSFIRILTETRDAVNSLTAEDLQGF